MAPHAPDATSILPVAMIVVNILTEMPLSGISFRGLRGNGYRFLGFAGDCK